MSRPERRRGRGGLFRTILEKFRQKGATNPEKAMTIEELELPPEFKELMSRGPGQSGVFVEIDGKYYFSEERWNEVRQQRGRRR